MDESYLCIDIGTNSIKVLEKDSNEQILRWGILERKNEFHSSIRPINPMDAAKALVELLGKMGAHSRPVVFSLPAFYSFTTIAEILVPELVPALPSTYRLSAWPMKDGRSFLQAIPLEVVGRYKEMCRLADLEFAGVFSESEAIAVRASCSAERVLMVNVDDRLTTFTLVNGGSVEYVFHSDFGRASESLGGAPGITPYVWDVIINKTKEIAGKMGAEQAYFSNSVFNIANGLPKISQQAFNRYGFSWSVRSAH